MTVLAHKNNLTSVANYVAGLLLTTACFNVIALTHAAELNGFRLESQSDGSLAVQVQADSLPAYDIEPSGNGVSILLKDTHLSDSLRQKGMPVVIDNRNRAIGRAVPGEGNTVKIVIPNWKPEQGALHVKADTGSTSFASETARSIAPRPRTAPTDGLSGAFESQFKSAAKALTRPTAASLGSVTALPAVEDTDPEASSTWRQAKTPTTTLSSRRKKVTYRPVPAATALPKVVTFGQTEPTVSAPVQSVASERPPVSTVSSYSATAPRAATPWPVVAQPIPTPESTGWGSYGQSTTEENNPYGIDSIADAASASQSAEPSVSLGTQLKQFFDGITGNRFSRPYGVAFWAMMIGVIFIACLGFLALAVGLLCTRLVFTPFGANSNEGGGSGLFSWRSNDSAPPTTLSEDLGLTETPSVRGPVAKRFPFVASGLSQSVAMYTPQQHKPLKSQRTEQPIRAPKTSEGIGLRRRSEILASEAPVVTPTHNEPVWRPHVGVVQAPLTPALVNSPRVSPKPMGTSAKAHHGWIPPEDDADLLVPSHQQPASPVERALHRLTL